MSALKRTRGSNQHQQAWQPAPTTPPVAAAHTNGAAATATAAPFAPAGGPQRVPAEHVEPGDIVEGRMAVAAWEVELDDDERDEGDFPDPAFAVQYHDGAMEVYARDDVLEVTPAGPESFDDNGDPIPPG